MIVVVDTNVWISALHFGGIECPYRLRTLYAFRQYPLTGSQRSYFEHHGFEWRRNLGGSYELLFR